MARIAEKVLRRCYQELKESMSPRNGLTDSLYSSEVISMEDKKKVEGGKDEPAQAEILIEILYGCGENGLRKLHLALQSGKRDSQKQLAPLLAQGMQACRVSLLDALVDVTPATAASAIGGSAATGGLGGLTDETDNGRGPVPVNGQREVRDIFDHEKLGESLQELLDDTERENLAKAIAISIDSKYTNTYQHNLKDHMKKHKVRGSAEYTNVIGIIHFLVHKGSKKLINDLFAILAEVSEKNERSFMELLSDPKLCRQL